MSGEFPRLSFYLALAHSETFPSNRYRLGKRQLNGVETPLNVRPGGGCGTHETLASGASTVANVGDDDQFRR
jgi:hypothetical protein